MKSLIYLLLLVGVTVIPDVLSNPHHTNSDGFLEKVTSDPLPANYLDALRKFSEKAVNTPSFDISNRSDRAILADPLSLGYLYAVLNEQQVFSVENQDISKALQLGQEEIARVYAALVSRLNQDRDVVAANAVFTRNTQLNTTDALEKLKSYRETLELVDNPKAVPTINAYLADHTKNLIRDQLLPSEHALYNSTQAVVVNTIHLKKNLRAPLKPVGQRKFQFGKTSAESRLVDTLELNDAKLRVFHGEKYSAVLVPLGSASTRNVEKSLILVRPKDTLSSFLKDSVQDIFQRDFIKKLALPTGEGIRLQLPVLNVTLAREFATEFERTKKIPSFTSAICDTSTERENFLQKIVQVSSLQLSADFIEIGGVFGVSVENVRQYRKEFGGSESSSHTNINSESGSGNLSGGVKSKYNKNDYISITESPSKYNSRSSLDTANLPVVPAVPVSIKHPEQEVPAADPEPEAEAEPEPEPDVSGVKSNIKSKSRSILDEDAPTVSLSKENQQAGAVPNKNEKIVPVHIESTDGLTNKNKHDKSKIKGEVSAPDTDFVFNSPFFAFIYDEELGPIQFLAVRDVADSQQQELGQNPTPTPTLGGISSEDFSEYAKLQRYVCIAPPAPFLPPPPAGTVHANQYKTQHLQHQYQH